MGLAERVQAMDEAKTEVETTTAEAKAEAKPSPKEDTEMAQAAKKTTTTTRKKRTTATRKKATAKPAARRATAKKPVAKRATAKKPAAKKPAAKKTAQRKPAERQYITAASMDCEEGFPLRFIVPRKAIGDFTECERKHPTPVKFGKTKAVEILERQRARLVLCSQDDVHQLLHALCKGKFQQFEDANGKLPTEKALTAMYDALHGASKPAVRKSYKLS